MKYIKQLIALLALAIAIPGINCASSTTTTTTTASSAQIHWGLSEMQGKRESQEDRYFAQEIKRFNEEAGTILPSWWFFGVLDGHGGEETAELASQSLPQNIETYAQFFSPQESLQNAIRDTESSLRAQKVLDGSTLICALIDETGTAWIGNLGDSRAIQVRNGKAINTTTDFKPTNLAELMRIEEAGGFVDNDRVGGNLAVSRTLGDFGFKAPATSEPEAIKSNIRNFVFTKLSPANRALVFPLIMGLKAETWQNPQAAINELFASTDEATRNNALAVAKKSGDWVSSEPEILEWKLQPNDRLILACDGLWDMVDNSQAASTLERAFAINYSNLEAQKPYPRFKEVGENWLVGPARGLRDLSYRNGSGDNITVMVVSYGVEKPQGAYTIQAKNESVDFNTINPQQLLKYIGQPINSVHLGTNIFTLDSLQNYELIGVQSGNSKVYAIFDKDNMRVITKLSPQNEIAEIKKAIDLYNYQQIYTLRNKLIAPQLKESSNVIINLGRTAKNFLSSIGKVADEDDLKNSKLVPSFNNNLNNGEIVLIKRSNDSWTYGFVDKDNGMIIQELVNGKSTSSKILHDAVIHGFVKMLPDRLTFDTLPYSSGATAQTTTTAEQQPTPDSITTKDQSEWASYINKKASPYDLASAVDVKTDDQLNDKELVLVFRSTGAWTYGVNNKAANNIAIDLDPKKRGPSGGPVIKSYQDIPPAGWVKALPGKPTFDALPY